MVKLSLYLKVVSLLSVLFFFTNAKAQAVDSSLILRPYIVAHGKLRLCDNLLKSIGSPAPGVQVAIQSIDSCISNLEVRLGKVHAAQSPMPNGKSGLPPQADIQRNVRMMLESVNRLINQDDQSLGTGFKEKIQFYLNKAIAVLPQD